jgi:hypothetical protein
VASAKPWYRSKLILFNIAAAVFGVLEASANLVRDALGLTDGQTFACFALVVAVVNAVLRVVTTQAIALRGDE